MARAQTYLLYLPLYVVFGVVGTADYSLRWTNDWQLAHRPSWDRPSTHSQWLCLVSCMNDVVCLPVLLAEQMLVFSLFMFLLWCNSPLLLGVLTHVGLWLIKTTSSTYIVGGTSWSKRTSCLCLLLHFFLWAFCSLRSTRALVHTHITYFNLCCSLMLETIPAAIDYWLLTFVVYSALKSY